MPCQFIASCFYLENPWAASQSDNSANPGSNPANAKAASHHPDVINQEPQGPQDPEVPGPEPQAAIIGPDLAAVNVETQAKPAAGGEVSTSPNGTPDKASKARAAKTFRAYLPSQCHRTYSCVHCRWDWFLFKIWSYLKLLQATSSYQKLPQVTESYLKLPQAILGYLK